MSFKKVFSISWIAFTAIAAIWSFSVPLGGGPDESMHAIKAASVVRGHLIGSPQGRPDSDPATAARIPAAYWDFQKSQDCYAAHPEVPASCAPRVHGGGGDADIPTTAGRYPPLYYLLVGTPSLFLSPSHAFAGMRLINAVLSGACLAAALALAFRARRTMLALAVSVAATPQAVFLGGVVNPNGLEIALAVLVWTSGLLLFSREQPEPARGLTAVLTTALALFILMRGLSPVWAVMIALTVVILTPAGTIRTVLWNRTGAIMTGVTAVVGIAAVAWIFAAHALNLLQLPAFEHTPLSVAVRGLISRTPGYITQLIGPVGALDTPVSYLAIVGWIAVVGMLMLLAFAVGSARERIALLFIVLGLLILPVALSANTVHSSGYAWQGRYGLPFAVGMPLVAACTLDRQKALFAPLQRGLTATVVLLLGTAEITSIVNALHRWAKGTEGSLNLFRTQWHSAPAMVGLVAASVVAYAGYRWWIDALCARIASSPAAIPPGTEEPTRRLIPEGIPG